MENANKLYEEEKALDQKSSPAPSCIPSHKPAISGHIKRPGTFEIVPALLARSMMSMIFNQVKDSQEKS